jgi:hypothetical protein
MDLNSANHWVQAMPGCVSCEFLSQGPGTPDPERSA